MTELASSEADVVTTMEQDRVDLKKLGYLEVLARGWGQFDNFACSFSALYVIGGIRVLWYIALNNGGPAALWSSWVSGSLLSIATAAILAESCSAYPAAGSIYYWAYRSWGSYGRFASFMVAAWTLVAWTSFLATDTLGIANYIISEVLIFNPDTTIPIETTDVKARAIVWALSLAFLALATSMNFLPPSWYAWVFRAGFVVIILDVLLNLIWLPIGVSQTYGFQSADFVFTSTYNGGDTSPGLNWCLSWFLVASSLVGEDASGHVAEETVNARNAAARGVFWSVVASSLIGLPIIIMFLFCTPPLDVFYGTSAPQPFVNLYALALGNHAHVVVTTVAILGSLLNTSISLVAVSRLVFAISRDSVFPFSTWLSAVSKSRQPHHAVIFISTIAGLLLCTQLPSEVAFSSLTSTAAAGSIAAYALVAFGRITFTRSTFKPSDFSLGRLGLPLAIITLLWNGFAFAVLCAPQVGDSELQGHPELFNYCIVIMVGVTLIAIEEWWRKSRRDWFHNLSETSTLNPVEDAAVSKEV